MTHPRRRKSQCKIYTCKYGPEEKGRRGGEFPRYGSPYVVSDASKLDSASISSRRSSDEEQVYIDDTKANLEGLDRLCEACDLLSQGTIDDQPEKGRKRRRMVKDSPEEEGSVDPIQSQFQIVTSGKRLWIGPLHIVQAKRVIDTYSLPNPVTKCQMYDILGISVHQTKSLVGNSQGAPFSIISPQKFLNRMAMPLPLVEH